MKKSNIIIYVIAALVSIFLLWLWYYLGLNHVDEPLDLVLSIVWWLMIVLFDVLIIRAEKTRQRRIRTIYVDPAHTFNSEAGLAQLEAGTPMDQVLEGILQGLKYNFDKADFPAKDDFEPLYFVRTDEYKQDKDAQQAAEATGTPEAADAATAASDAAVAAEAEQTAPQSPLDAIEADAEQAARTLADAEAAEAELEEPTFMGTSQQDDATTWKGQVVIVESKEERDFENREELKAILALL